MDDKLKAIHEAGIAKIGPEREILAVAILDAIDRTSDTQNARQNFTIGPCRKS